MLFLIPILLFILQYSSLNLGKITFQEKLLNSVKISCVMFKFWQSKAIQFCRFFFSYRIQTVPTIFSKGVLPTFLNRSFASKFLKVLSSQKSRPPYFNTSIKKCTVKIHRYIYSFFYALLYM